MLKRTQITLEDDGNFLVFEISQMPATKLQKFLLKALSLISGEQMKNVDFKSLQGEIKENGFALLQKIDLDKAEPLISQLYTCVKRKVDNTLVQVNQENIDGMVSDVRTLFKLQGEVLKHNLSFLEGENGLNSQPPAKNQTTNTFNMRT